MHIRTHTSQKTYISASQNSYISASQNSYISAPQNLRTHKSQHLRTHTSQHLRNHIANTCQNSYSWLSLSETHIKQKKVVALWLLTGIWVTESELWKEFLTVVQRNIIYIYEVLWARALTLCTLFSAKSERNCCLKKRGWCTLPRCILPRRGESPEKANNFTNAHCLGDSIA